MKIKSVFLSLKVLIYFVLLRTFGSVIHDISRKHEDVSVSHLRRYEKKKFCRYQHRFCKFVTVKNVKM